MPSKSRLFCAVAACLLLSNCGLIGTALRLAPYALLFADGNAKGTTQGKALEMRGNEVQARGARRFLPASGGSAPQVAFKH
ncbi:hypothetical protein [Prosthecobacter sp.]|uniref:hypothetical protein n=1 Tax=Prosthecobacter sp. TaxID=1965333 RepID=UPI00378321A0